MDNSYFSNRLGVASYMPTIFNEVSEINAKWHINPDGSPKVRDDDFVNRCILLMKSELMEAFEAMRKGNQPDDKLPQHPGESVELIDLFIRGIDFIVFDEQTDLLRSVFAENIGERDRIEHIPEDYTMIQWYSLIDVVLADALKSQTPVLQVFSALDMLIEYCDRAKIPMLEIYMDKTEYNRTRKDHSAEARASVGGKQF